MPPSAGLGEPDPERAAPEPVLRTAAVVRRADGLVVFQAKDHPDRFAARVIERASRDEVPVRVVAVMVPAAWPGGKRGRRASRGGW